MSKLNKLDKKWGSPDPTKEHPSKELNETIDVASPQFGGVKSKRDNKKEYIPKEEKRY